MRQKRSVVRWALCLPIVQKRPLRSQQEMEVSSALSPGLQSLVAAGEAGWVDSPSQTHLPMTSRSQSQLKEREGRKEGLAKACPKP